MDLLKVCADQFEGILKWQGLTDVEAMHSKKSAFNRVTAALVGSIALGVFRIVSLRTTIVLGGLSLLGRAVALESLKGDIANRDPKFFKAVKYDQTILYFKRM